MGRPGRCVGWLLVASVFLGGCPTMHLPRYEPRSFHSYPNTMVDRDIAIVVEPFTDEQEVVKYFGANLRDADLLPVFIMVENRTGGSLLLSKERIALISLGEQLPQAGKERERSDAASVGVGVAAAFVLTVPLVLISAKLGSDAKEINHNLLVKELKTTTLSPGAATSGFLYFPLPKVYVSLQQLHVRIPLDELPGRVVRTLEAPLAGRR